ncbi:NYN domain-containing protein [Marispirochaeta sp.]|jgi:uncharacterized LabA/DUF88 family protein|uniref:NYN domain-containing protein n=1 Tax=Marispirochaeta sp. TaxID=2038653 RepID=UPI0029C9794F|nr:NYN domain-containing protein [Marispirochaeta sp.]
MKDTQLEKLAVLIDADNAQASIIDGLLAEIAKYGIASVKRIYGDWTSQKLRSWKDTLLEYSIQPIQQFSYTTGKNATDSAMIIDAMDMLYTGDLDGFCIVSSDSDYTKLCARLREAGKTVYGFGEKKTPKPFVAAVDKFIYTEILREYADEEEEDDETSNKRRMTINELRQDSKLVHILRNAVEASADDSGWAYLGNIGQNIAKKTPDFDPRNYGFKKLSDLITATNLFEIEEKVQNNAPGKQIYFRRASRKKRK